MHAQAEQGSTNPLLVKERETVAALRAQLAGKQEECERMAGLLQVRVPFLSVQGAAAAVHRISPQEWSSGETDGPAAPEDAGGIEGTPSACSDPSCARRSQRAWQRGRA